MNIKKTSHDGCFSNFSFSDVEGERDMLQVANPA